MVSFRKYAVGRSTGSVRLLQAGMHAFTGETVVITRSDSSLNDVLRQSAGLIPARTRGRWPEPPRSGGAGHLDLKERTT